MKFRSDEIGAGTKVKHCEVAQASLERQHIRCAGVIGARISISGAVPSLRARPHFNLHSLDRLISVHVHLLNTLNGEIPTISILVQRLNCTRSGDFRMIDN